MADVLSKAEAFAKDPKNINSRGQLKPRAKYMLNKMVMKITYLSQFEKQTEYHF